MILIDTHVFIWWVQGDEKLNEEHQSILRRNEDSGILVSIISIWEIMKLVEKKRLEFSMSLKNWLEIALNYPGIKIVNLDVDIVLEIFNNKFEHKDPADQIIIATSNVKNIPLFTFDKKILNLPQVNLIKL